MTLYVTVRHGNVTFELDLSYRAEKGHARKCHVVDMCSDDFFDQMLVRNKQKIIDLSELELEIG